MDGGRKQNGSYLVQAWKSLKALDYLVFILCLAVFAAVFWLAIGFSSVAGEVSIKAPDGLYVYSLDTDQNFLVAGPLGQTRIEIKGKAVRVVDSPCRDKICVHSTWLHSVGQWTACLPNRIFLSITTGKSTEIDAVMY